MTTATQTYDPELFQLVPKEPNESMVNAGWDSIGWNDSGNNERAHPRDVFRAMLAAAPTPPASAQSVKPVYQIAHEDSNFWETVDKAFFDGCINEHWRKQMLYTTPPSAEGARTPDMYALISESNFGAVVMKCTMNPEQAQQWRDAGCTVKGYCESPPSVEGARDAALMSDIRAYLEDGLETPGFAEAQGSIDARALIARINALKSKKEA